MTLLSSWAREPPSTKRARSEYSSALAPLGTGTERRLEKLSLQGRVYGRRLPVRMSKVLMLCPRNIKIKNRVVFTGENAALQNSFIKSTTRRENYIINGPYMKFLNTYHKTLFPDTKLSSLYLWPRPGLAGRRCPRDFVKMFKDVDAAVDAEVVQFMNSMAKNNITYKDLVKSCYHVMQYSCNPFAQPACPVFTQLFYRSLLTLGLGWARRDRNQRSGKLRGGAPGLCGLLLAQPSCPLCLLPAVLPGTEELSDPGGTRPRWPRWPPSRSSQPQPSVTRTREP